MEKWQKLDNILPNQVTLESLSQNQKKLIEEFRVNNKDVIKEDTHDLEIARWFFARDWNLAATTDMFRKSMKWRELVGADYILEEFPKSPYYKFLTDHYPTNNSDPNCPKVLRCLDGTHFCVESMGALNSEAAALIPALESIKYHIWGMELANKQRNEIFQELGSLEMQQTTVLEDLTGLGMSHLSMVDTLKVFTAIDNDNYPETLRKVVIINVPTIFSIVWKAVELLWDAKQLAKFQFISAGSDYSSVLKKIVGDDYLPKDYTGGLDYSLPKATPLEQLKKELSTVEYRKDYKKDHVPRSGNLEHPVKVDTDGSVLHFEFKTIDYDVAFGIKYKNPDNNTVEVVLESKRYNSNVVPGFGRIYAKKGVYLFQWDNSYSWTRGKDLLYLFNIVQK